MGQGRPDILPDRVHRGSLGGGGATPARQRQERLLRYVLMQVRLACFVSVKGFFVGFKRFFVGVKRVFRGCQNGCY